MHKCSGQKGSKIGPQGANRKKKYPQVFSQFTSVQNFERF